ncbi:MAG TPA: hypothetical protein VM689_05460 [Aliidongia sp.]|nr:hypothetical protein [Aliidongia sp.]
MIGGHGQFPLKCSDRLVKTIETAQGDAKGIIRARLPRRGAHGLPKAFERQFPAILLGMGAALLEELAGPAEWGRFLPRIPGGSSRRRLGMAAMHTTHDRIR